MENLSPINDSNLLTSIFSYLDPLTKQKVMPQVSRLFRDTVQSYYRTPADQLEFKKACQDLRDKQRWEFEKSSFKYPFKRFFKENKKSIKDFRKAISQSLHGIVQNHRKFLPVSQNEALKYLEQKTSWINSLVCKIITPSPDKSDHCVIHYLDEKKDYKVFSKEIYLNYTKNCFTMTSSTGEEKNFKNLGKLIHSIQKKTVDKDYWTKRRWQSADNPLTEKMINHPLFHSISAQKAKETLINESYRDKDVPIILRYPTDKSPDRFVFHYFDLNEKKDKSLRFKIEREKNCFTIFNVGKEGKEIDFRSYTSVDELVKNERRMIKEKLGLA